ncbi:sodium/potassium/calcium exchanger 5-like [Lineus longissimus]|uniref:sodium/potassium/calcium exchanger 5-like n=1 Tax=Lineus longissimus TaxID=88925 RepID=UPI002B4F39C5
MVTDFIWRCPRWLTGLLALLILSGLHFVKHSHHQLDGADDVQNAFLSRVLLSTNGSSAPDVSNCTPRESENFPDFPLTMETKRNGGVLVIIFIALYAFGALAVVCNYYFLSAMEAICHRLGLSEDVAGATFMAIGTSAPEIGTAFIGVFVTESNVGLDTVAGSTVFNMFFITSLCGLFGLHKIAIKKWPVVRDLMSFVFAAVVLIGVTSDGVVAWYEGLLVSLVYLAYVIIIAFSQRIERALDMCCRCGEDEETIALLGDQRQQDGKAGPSKVYSDVKETAFSSGRHDEDRLITTSDLKADIERSQSKLSLSASTTSGYRSSNDLDGEESLMAARIKYHSTLSLAGEESYKTQLSWPKGCLARFLWIVYLPFSILLFLTIPDCNRPGCWRNLYILTFLSSVVWVSLLSYLLVWMIEIIGEVFFIPESIMGITFLAIGTSIPDAVASLLACRKGYGDMAISNILGSNILDIVCTGLPWFIKTAIVIPDSLIYTGTSSVLFTIISLLSSSLIVILGFLAFRWTLDKRIGVSYLILYMIYIVICLLYELNIFGLVNLPLCPEGDT